jgi:hypothetical protein
MSASSEELSVEVKASTIAGAGLGLFATKTLPPGSDIVAYTGEALTRAQYLERYPLENARYVFSPKPGVYIDAVDPATSSLARYVNALPAAEANARLTTTGTVAVKARAIQAGEEVFVDYGAGYSLGAADE